MQRLTFTSRKWWKSEWDIKEGERALGSFVVIKNFTYQLAEYRIGEAMFRFSYKGWNTAKIFGEDRNGASVLDTVSSSVWGMWTKIKVENTVYTIKSNWSCTTYTATDESGHVAVVLRSKWWGGGSFAEVSDTKMPTTLLLGVVFYVKLMTEIGGTAASGAMAGPASSN